MYAPTIQKVARLSSDFGPPKDPAILLANQILGADNSTGIGATANAQLQARFVAPQVYVCTLVSPSLCISDVLSR
jgi:hypothetical protein